MGFKHTGPFPEQAVNWDWMAARRRAERKSGIPLPGRRARCRRALAPLCPRLRHAGGYVPLDGECGDGCFAFQGRNRLKKVRVEFSLEDMDMSGLQNGG